jgi:hypothetical protein
MYEGKLIEEAFFDKGCSKLLNERKQAKLQLLKDPSKKWV